MKMCGQSPVCGLHTVTTGDITPKRRSIRRQTDPREYVGQKNGGICPSAMTTETRKRLGKVKRQEDKGM